MPDIENSRKTAEKGAEWVAVKQPKKSQKNTRRAEKSYGVYHLPEKTRERVYTIGPERRVYTIEPQTRKKKKRRVSTVVVYAFSFPDFGHLA